MSCRARRESAAVRATETGTESAFFLSSGGDRVFCVTHVPNRPPAGVVVVCSSVLTDAVLNYRREVAMSRALAERGIAVGRFHYRGSGHSEGDPLAITLESMVEDAAVLSEHLKGAVGAVPMGVLGSRVGALVGASFVTALPGNPLAVWEPVLRGESFIGEALQAGSIARMTSSAAGKSLKRALAEDGVADVLGFPLGRRLEQSLAGVSLDELLGAGSRQILYMVSQPAGGSHSQMVDNLRGGEIDVAVEPVEGPKAWWFVDDFAPTPHDIPDAVIRWFLSNVSGVSDGII